MKITALMENTSCNAALATEHGLSLLIEYGGTRILFDAGPSGAFAGNAEKLGADLVSVDFAVLSHGHYDHSGGLPEFFRRNGKAGVYLKRGAEGQYYAGILGVPLKYVGIDRAIVKEYGGRLRFLETEAEPAPGCHILTDIEPDEQYRLANRYLYEKTGRRTVKDAFRHELVLVFEEEDGITVITGCSHNGIISLVETARRRFPGKPVKAVVGGFHLMGRSPDNMNCDEAFLNMLAAKLMEYDKTYTCHCTGEKAYALLKVRMGERLEYLRAGMTIGM